MKSETRKLWGGRFSKPTDSLAHQFGSSLHFDARLFDEDIAGSVAWAHGLVSANVLSEDEAVAIIAGLEQVRLEFMSDSFEAHPEDEDIHSAVERRLTEIVGPLGGKLHTGRSRNDQVATDFRLWTMRACDLLLQHLAGLQRALLASAETDLTVAMPGYTHMQRAQPITWGHWALSHLWPLTRDSDRFAHARRSASVLPLGAAALAGTAFSVDRHAIAVELCFESVCENSVDAVSDRDFAVDFLYAAAVVGVHLSQLSQQLILFSSAEFGFIVLDEAYATGSSLMPQKKNPDVLELTRGKSGRLIGNLTGLLVTLKGLSSAYDRDLQEDKEPVFDAFDVLSNALPLVAGIIRTIELRPERMAAQIDPGMMATDLADYLVMRGVPFREAHAIVGKVVRMSEERGVGIADLAPEDLHIVSDQFGDDVWQVFDIDASLARRAAVGGTATDELRRQLEAARRKST